MSAIKNKARTWTLAVQSKCAPPFAEIVCPVQTGGQLLCNGLRRAPADDVPVMKYASGFARYETRLAMTSGSAVGSFTMSELAIPEAFAV